MSEKKEKIKEAIGIPEITDRTGKLWKAIFAEFLGNIILNFFGCAGCVFIADSETVINVTRISLAFGFIIFVLVLTVGHVSGGHFNPAVSIACLLLGKISVIRTFLYIIVQCAGSTVGSGLLKALTPQGYHTKLGIPKLNALLSPFQGAGIEFLLGFFLLFTVFAVTDPNRPTLVIMAPLGVGLTIAAGHFAAIEFTGSAMNPARALGSAVILSEWNDHWIYWLGPITGGILGALIYHFVFSAPPKEDGNYLPVPPEDINNRNKKGNP